MRYNHQNMGKRIYLLLGHPDKTSFNGHLADAYEQAARAAGHEVRRQNLGDMTFDPILWEGYKSVQTLEPDLELAKDNITWCTHWVIVYPVWWGAVPALLKGFLDRALHPNFAFKYHEKGPFWDKLLKGRSARLITTSDGPWIYLWLMYRNSDLGSMRRAVLEFCGVKPVRVTRIDRVKSLDAEARQVWLKKIERLGTAGE